MKRLRAAFPIVVATATVLTALSAPPLRGREREAFAARAAAFRHLRLRPISPGKADLRAPLALHTSGDKAACGSAKGALPPRLVLLSEPAASGRRAVAWCWGSCQ
jgi:hypothetical protein